MDNIQEPDPPESLIAMRWAVAGRPRNLPLDKAMAKWLKDKPVQFAERFALLEQAHEEAKAAMKPTVGVEGKIEQDAGTEKVKELLEGEWAKLEGLL